MWPDLPKSHVILDDDAMAFHFGAFSDGRLIGVASFFPVKEECRLRKLAVEDAFQGRGVASQLLQSAFSNLQIEGCKAIWCDARLSAVGFYIKNGFEVDADVFQKHGLDYVVARRVL